MPSARDDAEAVAVAVTVFFPCPCSEFGYIVRTRSRHRIYIGCSLGDPEDGVGVVASHDDLIQVAERALVADGGSGGGGGWVPACLRDDEFAEALGGDDR